MVAGRRRLDTELVRRGLAPNRSAAQRLIDAKKVFVAGAPADKAARQVSPAEPVTVAGPPPRYGRRGGDKLDAALERFPVEVSGMVALDAGSSTGGFTDCLLQRGAARVVAVDVGRHQLHERLRHDPRVVVREQTDIRHLQPADIGGPFPLVVADLSFISLRSVAEGILRLANPGADLVVLVKPQFEAGRAVVSRGKGVVTDPVARAEALEKAAAAFTDRGAAIMGAMVSPLRGAEGNVEFFLWLRAPGDGRRARSTERIDLHSLALAGTDRGTRGHG